LGKKELFKMREITPILIVLVFRAVKKFCWSK